MDVNLDPANIPSDQIWIVVLGFVISFILAFAVGANDVANAFGTSVGSKVLSLRMACILGTIFETSGAVLLGAQVSGTIRSGIANTALYEDEPILLMLGQLSSLIGCAIWLLLATFLKLPVSTTHSIVGATVGFTLVAKGVDSVIWSRVIKIIISWITSPVLSGFTSTVLFAICKYAIIVRKPSPLEAGLRALPLIYALTISVNLFSIILSAPTVLYFHYIPLWGNFVASFGIGLALSLFVKFYVVSRMRITIKKFLRSEKDRVAEQEAIRLQELKASSKQAEAEGHSGEPLEAPVVTEGQILPHPENGAVNEAFNNDEKPLPVPLPQAEKTDNPNSTNTEKKLDPSIADPPAVGRLFSFTQVVTAGFISFAHGGNDVANSIGPLIGIWLLAITQDISYSTQTPFWILLYGGVGMSFGLWILGRRVMETVGSNLTVVTPSSGFTINFGAALTVLIASNLGIPISTTQCIVGSVVCVGRFRSKANIDWSLFRNIVLSWVITLPASVGLSALCMFVLMQFYPQYHV